MITSYPVGDFIIRIKNASLARQKEVSVPKTKLIKGVAECLVRAGILSDVEDKDGVLKARIVYRRKEPVFSDAKLISKPGLRIYIDTKEIEERKDPSFLIISTSSGVITSKEARKKRMGGEVIAQIL